MKAFVVFALLAVSVYGAEEKKEDAAAAAAAAPEGHKTFKRLIPADVLRGTYFFIYILWKKK